MTGQTQTLTASLPWPRLRDLALSGRSFLFFGEAMSRLSAYLMGRFSLEGKSVILVDAAQAFDPYLVARLGRLAGTSPRSLLERIRLSRTFTCHQLTCLLCDILPGCRGGRHEGPLFVLGPCSLFYDDQVVLQERQQLFRKITSLLPLLEKRYGGLYLFQPPLSEKIRKLDFGRRLAGVVEWVIRIRQGEKTLEGRLLRGGGALGTTR